MTLIAYVFPKLQTLEEVVGSISKTSRVRRPFNKQHGKRSQTLLKSDCSNFIIFIDPFEEN